ACADQGHANGLVAQRRPNRLVAVPSATGARAFLRRALVRAQKSADLYPRVRKFHLFFAEERICTGTNARQGSHGPAKPDAESARTGQEKSNRTRAPLRAIGH